MAAILCFVANIFTVCCVVHPVPIRQIPGTIIDTKNRFAVRNRTGRSEYSADLTHAVRVRVFVHGLVVVVVVVFIVIKDIQSWNMYNMFIYSKQSSAHWHNPKKKSTPIRRYGACCHGCVDIFQCQTARLVSYASYICILNSWLGIFRRVLGQRSRAFLFEDFVCYTKYIICDPSVTRIDSHSEKPTLCAWASIITMIYGVLQAFPWTTCLK